MTRLVLRYPDGSYSYAFKSDHREGWLEVLPKQAADVLRATNNRAEDYMQHGSLLSAAFERFTVAQIQDEVEYMVRNLEFILDPDTAIQEYLAHRTVLYALITLNLFFELALAFYCSRNLEFLVI